MDSKSGFGSIGGVTKCAPLKFSLLTVLLWFLRSFWRILIVRAPNARSCTIPACLNACDRIVHKRREILSHTSVFKFKI